MSKKYFVTGLALLCLTFSKGPQAQPKADDQENVRVFVQKFYDWYSVLFNAEAVPKEGAPSSQQTAMRHGREFFSANLLKALTNYYNSPVKEDEIGLDFDPFANAQDIGSGYQVGSVKPAGSNFLVDVRDAKKGEPKKAVLNSELILVAQVTKENGHMVISNFIYPSPDGRSNLLDILKTLQKGSQTNSK